VNLEENLNRVPSSNFSTWSPMVPWSPCVKSRPPWWCRLRTTAGWPQRLSWKAQ
jgi:hypothetical protein